MIMRGATTVHIYIDASIEYLSLLEILYTYMYTFPNKNPFLTHIFFLVSCTERNTQHSDLFASRRHIHRCLDSIEYLSLEILYVSTKIRFSLTSFFWFRAQTERNTQHSDLFRALFLVKSSYIRSSCVQKIMSSSRRPQTSSSSSSSSGTFSSDQTHSPSHRTFLHIYLCVCVCVCFVLYVTNTCIHIY